MDTNFNTGEFFISTRNKAGNDVMFRYIGTLPVLLQVRSYYIYSLTRNIVLRNFDKSEFTPQVHNAAPLVDDDWMRENNFLPRVLTRAEAQQCVREGKGVTTLSSRTHNAFFFTNDYCHALRVTPPLPSCWVSGSTSIPHYVVARASLPSGCVNTVDDFITIYHRGEVQLETQADLDKCIACYDPVAAKERLDAEAETDPHYNGYDD